MFSHELIMSTFLHLAKISDERGQILPRNKFLILSGAAACSAGWLSIAKLCRDVVLADNGSHLLNRYQTFPDALRSAEFQVYLKQLARFCSMERAEHLLEGQGISTPLLSEPEAIQILATMQKS